MGLFVPYHSKGARAVSTALALMLEQRVATWAEVETTAENAKTVNRINEGYSHLTRYLRMPTKIDGSRSLTPAVTIAFCMECHGWQTVLLTKGRSVASGVSISPSAAASVVCVKTTDCPGEQEIALPAIQETQIDS